MKLKRLVRKSVLGILAKTPRSWRHALYRQLLQIPKIPPQGLVVKFAESPEEFDQAFRLLQSSYAEIGLAEEGDIIRTTKFHSLPTTKVAIVSIDGQVVATATHILDSPFGLPIEDHWSLSHLREQGLLMGEISSLAVDRHWRHDHGLFLYVTRFLMDYARLQLGVDLWTLVTHPSHRDFYEGVFCSEPLSEEIKQCSYVKDAPGCAQQINLNTLPANYSRLYSGKPQEKDIHDFYMERDLSACFVWPHPSTVLTNSMSAQYFRDLFGPTTSTFQRLETKERLFLADVYSLAKPQFGLPLSTPLRQRYPICQPATLQEGNLILPVRILNVSTGGAKIISKFNIEGTHKNMQLMVKAASKQAIKIPVEVVWSQHQKIVGLKIAGTTPKAWSTWTQELKNEFQQSINRSAA